MSSIYLHGLSRRRRIGSVIVAIYMLDSCGAFLSASGSGRYPGFSYRGLSVVTENIRSIHSSRRLKLTVNATNKEMYERQDSIHTLPLSPIPVMPSQLFQELALSQLELLANSIPCADRPGVSKIKTMALYLPQENVNTGQLEFLPAIHYPHPSRERVFIANEAASGVAPALPRTLTTLPGFAHATSLLPGYPMVSGGSEASVGVVEEVICDLTSGAAALSVPLFSGSRTVGVLLVSPSISKRRKGSAWTKEDREQVGRAGKSLSLALSMDTERAALQMQNDRAARALSDSLHQIKNPLQAMRTYGKLLQRRIADLGLLSNEGMTPQLLEMAEHLLVQSDRLADRLKPVDTIVDSLSERTPFVLNPAAPTKTQDSLVSLATPLVPWESEILEFARESKTSGELVIFMPTKKVAASGSNGPSNSTTSFSGNGSDVSTYTEDDGAGEMPSSLFSEMDLEMSFLSDVLDPVLAAFRAIAEDRGIMLSYDDTEDLPGVTICPQALQEALINVIDNAFTYVFLPKPGSRFGPNPSAEVRIRLVQNSKGSDAGVTILVEDNGPGIPAETRDQIFDRGVRSDSTRSIEGSGIGLDIAKTLVRRMGGILRVAKNDAFPNSLDGTAMELILFRNPKV